MQNSDIKKLIIFDLDGVLIQTKKYHFDSLNLSLSKISRELVISEHEHLAHYDGLSTIEKLKKLTLKKKLDPSLYKKIWADKQKNTQSFLKKIEPDIGLINYISDLKNRGFYLACCSNSIRSTVNIVLNNLNIIEFFDCIISNEDVGHPKPSPEMYWRCITTLGVLPNNTLIIEDSPVGLSAAENSGANVLRIENTKKLILTRITDEYFKLKQHKWKNKNLNILIPMAGNGERFKKQGFKNPKPLIDVNGEPMIKKVVDSLNIDANYIFITKKDHKEIYNLETVLNLICKNCQIIEIDYTTKGAACTTLLAESYINNDEPLIIANSDQYINWSSAEFLYKMQETDADASILTFNNSDPKWSYAKTDETGFVTEVAEKRVISEKATVGIYFWKKGSDYVKYAKKMIEDNKMVNNEFYVCPVFNEAIADNKRIITYDVDSMYGLGTPEDLNSYLKIIKENENSNLFERTT